MKTELKKLQRLKSYGQIKIHTEIRAYFLCIMAQNFNELEGPLSMLGFVSIFFGSSPVGLGRLIKAKYLMLKLFAQKSHTKH